MAIATWKVNQYAFSIDTVISNYEYVVPTYLHVYYFNAVRTVYAGMGPTDIYGDEVAMIWEQWCSSDKDIFLLFKHVFVGYNYVIIV